MIVVGTVRAFVFRLRYKGLKSQKTLCKENKNKLGLLRSRINWSDRARTQSDPSKKTGRRKSQNKQMKCHRSFKEHKIFIGGLCTDLFKTHLV